MNRAEPIAGEIERLLQVERELEATLGTAKREAAAIREEAEHDRGRRDEERQRALEEEIERRRNELLLRAGAELEQAQSAAAADAARWDLSETSIARIADRIVEDVLEGAEP
jgi:hypothetical protein